MRNVKINEAESIFENFWDVGESYPDNEKYSCLTQYKITVTKTSAVRNDWASVEIKMTAGEDKIIMERDCVLEIEGYDVFRFCASISENVSFRIICCIDGEEREIINASGYNRNKEYDGNISGKVISHIRMEFYNNEEKVSIGNLLWLGLSNAEAEKKMLSEKTPYDEKWEGCFAENYEIRPQYGIYFDSDELKQLRKKLSKPPFAAHMELLRSEAKAALSLVPEKDIGDYVHKKFMRFIRERDKDKVVLIDEMQKLAFVGIVDENIEMLKMACRMALSVAHCRYFCESIIGVFPGATWHHRSFTEESVCKALCDVLEWAGGLLTWHGKNIIYDAIIMKGLPRLDADIKTMDYMWGMNQGTAFASSLVIILISLTKRYPRYSVRVDEAERDMLAMWEKYVYSDGGSIEGPQYWEFTLSQMIDAIYLLARYRNVTVEKYAPDSIKKSSDYGQAVLSEVENYYIPINDAHMKLSFGRVLTAFLASVSGEMIWKKLSNKCLYKKPVSTDRMIGYLIFAKKFDENGEEETREFISLPISGISRIKRKTEDFGTVAWYSICEKIIFGHSHADKGSFILEADGKALLIDRGVCDYNNPYVRNIQLSEAHNVAAAVKDGRILSQCTINEKIDVRVIQDEYTDGVYLYGADVTQSWTGYFKKNIRRIISPNPYLYLIYDDIEAEEGVSVCFILNTYGRILQENNKFVISEQINVYPVSPNFEKSTICEVGTDGVGTPINRLCMYGKEGILITAIELAKPDESKVNIISDCEIAYENMKITVNGNGAVIDGKIYRFK